MTTELSVILAGGGTAGHVSPLLAIGDALRAAAPGVEITAVGTADGLETRLVPAAGYRLETINKVPFPRRPNAAMFSFPFKFKAAIDQAKAILTEAKADAVVGVGGYVCTPVYLAANKLGIPVFIHEANARAGLANKLGARKAAGIGVVYSSSGLPGARVVGMPMRKSIAAMDTQALRPAARAALGLDGNSPVLVVTGGSSGAASINRAVSGSLDAIAAAGVQVLHITGAGKGITDASGDLIAGQGYRQVEYVDGMQNAYAAADLIVARSGAGTVSELAVAGVPSVLVPLPIGNGEQKLNAADLVAAGGAVLIDDADFTPEYFASVVLPLLTDAPTLAAMSAAARAQGRNDAAEAMAAMVLEGTKQQSTGRPPKMGS